MNAARRRLLAATIATIVLLAATSANGWWGYGGPGAWAWDPQEAYLDEYGFLDRWGPSRMDIDRMYRDNWYAARGYPIHRGVGPYGPSMSDIHRQQMRKMRRAWGYPY
jgi:hypothetical protein